jgi:hypothetical protein
VKPWRASAAETGEGRPAAGNAAQRRTSDAAATGSALAAVLAVGLIAAGCGGEEEETTRAPETAPAVLEQAQKSLQDAVDEANQSAPRTLEGSDGLLQECLDSVAAAGLPDDEAQTLRDFCESGGTAMGEALEELGR